MRILDRYLLREFILPVVYCFDAFVLLWLVMELVSDLDDFLAAKAGLGQVAHYYLIQFPEAFVLMVPTALLLGLLFCLANLGRHNELLAMRTSGLSVWRLAVPLVAVGAAAALLVFAANEWFVPGSKQRAQRYMARLRGQPVDDALTNFFFSNPAARRDWYARRFDPRRGTMDLPEFHEQLPDGQPKRDVYAQRSRWLDNGWQFEEVEIHDHSRQMRTVIRVAVTNFAEVTESPRRLALEGKQPDEMTSAQLRRYVRAKKRAGDWTHLADYQVALHKRYAAPLTPLLVVWIGIPLGFGISRSGPLRAVGVSLLLVVAYYFLTHIIHALGAAGWIAPALAAWGPNILFFGLGTVLLVRIR